MSSQKVVRTWPLGLALEPELQLRVQAQVTVPEVGPRPLPTKSAKKGRLEVILSHWFNTLDGFQTLSMAFYESVRQAIERRQIPKVEMLWSNGMNLGRSQLNERT